MGDIIAELLYDYEQIAVGGAVGMRILIIILSILCIGSAYGYDYKDAATFSLVVYDDWQKPSKPLPEGWRYFIKLPVHLQIGGYYAESFIKCDEVCEVVTAHRGSTLSILDSYEDLLVFLELTPNYYTNAIQYIDAVKKEARSRYPRKEIHFMNTGHSLGAVMVELAQAYDKSNSMESVVFDSPGSKNIITHLMDMNMLPSNALENAMHHVTSIFSSPNAINTCNAQIASRPYSSVDYHEDFSNIPLDVIGAPGWIYYFAHYSIFQHRIDNFYNAMNVNKSNKDSDHWPVGLSDGYAHYLKYDDGHNPTQYWKNYISYVWNHNKGHRNKYHNHYQTFLDDFKKKLKADAGLAEKHSVNNSVTLNKLDSEVFSNANGEHRLLGTVINGVYSGRAETLKQIYANASVDKKLYYAVICDDRDMAEKLITQANANVNSIHGEGRYSLLQISILLGYLDITKLLLKYHANTAFINKNNDTAWSMISHVRADDAGDYYKALVEGGAKNEALN